MTALDGQSLEEPLAKPEDRYTGALAGIAKRHEALRSQQTLELQVPGYEGQMKVGYRLLPEAEMDRLLRRNEEVKAGEGIAGAWKVEADTIVALCDRLYVRDPEAEDWLVLEDEDGPIRFEGRFAKLMESKGVKVNGARAREIVLDFFSPRTNPSDSSSPRLFPNAMEAHVNAIGAWSRNARDLIASRLLGE